ncbi:MAG: cellulase family glycosylhydrolase [Verrucomicrobiota bacterium]
MTTYLRTALILAGFMVSCLTRGGDAQIIGTVDTSKWRGFNLLEKYNMNRNTPFNEDDFKWIAELGFNYVRLPMDYRCYVEKGDWLKFKEDTLKEVDQAIELGKKYHIHVTVNLHRAPGFCINPPEEPSNLWTNEHTLSVFVDHWVMFAKRYRQVPPEHLSFNLLNEPTHTSRENFLKVFCRTIEAIQKEDPRRLIIVDGLNVGKEPLPEFLKYDNVIQATRGYHPGTISHYKASWVKGSEQWPEPVWPSVKLIGNLYGPVKPDLKSPLTIQGAFKAGTEISLKFFQISQKNKLMARADGKTVAEKVVDPKASPEDWKRVDTEKRYVLMQPTRDLFFTVSLPTDCREFTLENVEGDWLKFSELTIRLPGGSKRTYGTDMSYGKKQVPLSLEADGRLSPPPGVPADAPLKDYLKPWLEIAARGETVFVGEWGCHNRTPHPVALAWMKSWLDNWKEARFGWALWNFRGSFGILDSGRTDVVYEDWHGHKLDREMLTLLQQYQK